MLKAGIDFSVRTRSADWILSFNAPFRRGGLLGHGSQLRVDWIPARGNAWQVGVLLPLERHMGRTRPRDTEVDLPRLPPSPPPRPARAVAVDEALGQVRIAARWIFPLTHVFWEDSREDREKSLERTRREISEFKALIGTRDALRPEGVSLAGEVARLHGEMARAFGEILEGYRRYPFLADEFPFAPSFFQALLGDAGAPNFAALGHPLEGARERAQQLHRKTQFLATRASLQELAQVVATHQNLNGPFFRAARSEPLLSEERAALAAEEAWLGSELVPVHRQLPEEARARSIYYLTVGSLNTDTRGHVLDGENIYVVSGESSLVAYTDFAALVGATTWLDSQEELDRLLPPVTHLERRISRWVRKSV